MKRLFLLLAFFTSALTSWAHDFEVDGIYYNITSSADLTVSVTYRGSYSSSYSNEYSGVVVIPDSVTYNGKTYSVTSIGGYAFYDCSSLTSITISESVTSIESSAFSGCSSLTSITIPESVTSIGDGAFRTCNSLREVVFEDGGNTLSLGRNSGSSYDNEGLFYDCPLVSVYLGRNLTYGTSGYGYSPFYKMKTLTSIIIGDSVTSIGDYAFYGCGSLTSITIPESVTSISRYAFEKCSGLHLVIISSPLTSIESQAFSGCSPEKVIWLCNTPPQGHSSLNGMVNYVPNEQFKGKSNAVVYPYLSSLFEVDGMIFVPVSPSERTCDLITCSYDSITMNRLAIPEKVQFKGIDMNIKSVGPYAFCNTNITELDIKKGVSAISSTAFLNCSKLAKITVSDENVTFDSRNDCNAIIEKGSSKLVQGCINTVIPQDVKIIGDYAFYNCTELNDIELPNDIASIGNYAFYNCDSLNVNLVLDKVESIGDNAFYGCGNIANISIGHRVSSIGKNAFNDCIGLISVSLNCSNIGDWFRGNASIEEVVLGDSVVSIGQDAFKNCSKLASVTIPKGVVSIGDCAFSGCSGLASIIMPESVTSVGSSAFYGCSGLTSIIIPESVTSIGNNTFKDCKGLTDVVIAERKQGKTLALGNYVFANCPLDSVYIGGAISYNTSSSNGYSPFYRNTSLRTVVITNREEQIYDYEFYGCTNLKSVTIGNGVKSIGKYAFSGCSSLTGFSFGSNMETIDTEAFSDCTKLTSITSYAAAPPTCGSQALDDVNKWECVLRVPIGYTAAYQAADQWKDFFFVEDVVELERYVLTYMVDGEVYYTDTLVHKETVTHPEIPVKEGYTFSGWDKILTAMPAEDATINGAFIINKYLVTFKIGDEVIASDSLEYGASIVAPEAPEKEGYTFNGWGEMAEEVPAHDVTYEGSYTVNTYNVYYYVGEELVHTAEVTYGEAIPEYVYEPAEEGYTFLGWIGDAYETMPAHDVTYTANIDDAIEELTIDNSQLTIYDLTGRKLDIDDIKDLSKGIYIINGKQVLVK